MGSCSFLNGALEWSSTKDWIVAFLSEKADGIISQDELNALLLQQLDKLTDVNLDDGLHRSAVKRPEYQKVVESVEKLRSEVFTNRFIGGGRHRFKNRFIVFWINIEGVERASEIGCQKQDSVFEIYPVPDCR